ncbi:MAG: AAA family ATPase, partial [Anaerolineae bacterium]|nr:AAA family ATPase [Anaerolineae bacterium]NIN99234.1 AAA family ATPase [Anaerolineae bacterium]NIQ82073.1 AAA family ATPase [Anaerolineae bacterium]
MNIQKTNQAAQSQGLKLLVYGQAGAGKTRLCATVPDRSRAIILSAEAGLLSLRDYELDYVAINSLTDLQQAYLWLRENVDRYDWVCIDSASEIAEVCLSEEKKASSDGRRAYGEMADKMFGAFRAFRDLPCNVYFSAKMGRVEDDGRQVYGPSFPGKQLEQGISYLFDEVMVLHAVR